MRWSPWMRFGSLTLLMALLVAGGCDDLTDPTTDFDPEQAAQAMEEMVAAVDTVEMANAFMSVGLADVAFGGTSMYLASRSPLALDVAGAEPGELAADVIPAELYGTTFEWNEVEMAYVASDATGAPEKGVRVIYYAIDPTSGMPATPLNALGYVDLHDLSTMESDRLGIEVVRYSDEATLADYYIDASFTITQSSYSVALGAVGFLSNGVDQLNFDVSWSMTATETLMTLVQEYTMGLEGTDRAISFSSTMTGDPQSQGDEPATMEAEATISTGNDSVRMVVSYADNALDGTVYLNGDAVVLMSGTLDNPVFTNTNGDALTTEQRAALHRLWEAIGDMFDFVEHLFDFVGD